MNNPGELFENNWLVTLYQTMELPREELKTAINARDSSINSVVSVIENPFYRLIFIITENHIGWVA